MNLARFPRIRLAHLPTPLEPLERLSAALGGPAIWIKRDDCTGLATGGNKTRKLEFLMAEALAEGADVVVTQGAVQSNHARQTAAAAARLGLDCHILLENRTGSNDRNYLGNGNVLLDRLHGASIETRDGGLDMNAELGTVSERLRAEGRRPYLIPGGGSNTTGALGYANCALELMSQSNDRSLVFDVLVHATGSAGTHAGLVAGLSVIGAGLGVHGFGVRAPKERQEDMVHRLAVATAEVLDRPGCVRREDIVADCNYVGKGYGIPRADTIEAIQMFARLEGILLDPVYSGKAAAGLVDYCRTGRFAKGQRVVFLHTGGAAALFGYDSAFEFGRADAR